MHNPAAAADELERCVRDLGFHGAMINGQTNGEYLDLDKYSVFWERAADWRRRSISIPAILSIIPRSIADHSELWGPVCSWAFETGAHALRLVFAGVFERYPNARLVLGHMGETLPFISGALTAAGWSAPRHARLRASVFYIRRNIVITTSGVCDGSSLRSRSTPWGMTT